MGEKLNEEEYNEESKEIITATIDKGLYKEIFDRIKKINDRKKELKKKPMSKSYLINKVLKIGWEKYKEDKGLS